MISLIIPVFNEQKYILPFTNQLLNLKDKFEILFVDGGSSDKTKTIIEDQGFNCLNSDQGRAIQMNFGAQKAQGKYLFFLHIDIELPSNISEILKQLISKDIQFSNFKLAFDFPHWFLKFNARFSYLSYTPFQFGDQGLWVKKDLFQKVNGFNESMVLVEDQDLVKRLKSFEKLQKLDAVMIVSARKYLKHGIFKLQFVYFYIYLLYRLGVKQGKLKKIMEKLLA